LQEAFVFICEVQHQPHLKNINQEKFPSGIVIFKICFIFSDKIV
jgi:hypothetical protein